MPTSWAFTRQHRLLTGTQYQTVFDHTEWKVGNAVFLLLARKNQQPQPRLGLVIGRKRAKRAVDRACIKRRAREQFRLRQQNWQVWTLSCWCVGVLTTRIPPTSPISSAGYSTSCLLSAGKLEKLRPVFLATE